MSNILSFPDKKNERSITVLHDDALIEESRAKLRTLYAQMELIIKEINHHKKVLNLLEKGNR